MTRSLAAVEGALFALREIAQGAENPKARAARAVADFIAMADEMAEDVPPSYQPDLGNPGQALARRVQEALEREFDGEELFACVVVVEEPVSRIIGVAATAIPLREASALLNAGRGAVNRMLRVHGE